MNPGARALQIYRQHGLLATIDRGLSKLKRSISAAFYRAVGKEFVRTQYGVRMRANWTDATFNFCFSGAYGRVLSDLITAQDAPFEFWDIGANQGLYSLLAARNSNCMRVLAFEPVSKTASIFEANIDANGLGGKITCIRAAISNKVGSHEIYISPGHSGVASLTMNSGVQRHREAIELICIDQVDALSSSSLPVLIKIDVEGHEGVVISELARSCHLPRIFGIFYEVDEAWSDPSELQQVLANAGFGNFKRFGVGTHYDILATK